MTKLEIALIGKEFTDHYYDKYHARVEKTYKYRGEVKTRTEFTLTAEGRALLMGDALNEKMFTCPCCGKMVSFNDLEYWGEDVEMVVEDGIPCSYCYEEMEGDDL